MKRPDFLARLCLPLLLLLGSFLGACIDNTAGNDQPAGSVFSFNDNGGLDIEGGSSGTGNQDLGGGSSGTGITTIAQGTVTAFGSIYMNGIVFDTAGASITIDDLPAAETDLRVGMTGRITGEADPDTRTGQASRIAIRFNVKGPVDAIDPANNTLIVAGQTVVFDALTVFEALTPASLNAGDSLAVSGLSDTDSGPLHASYIRQYDDTAPVEINGRIHNLDRGAETFDIGAQTVAYARAGFVGTSSESIRDGMSVRVRGRRNDAGILLAEHLTAVDPAPAGTEDTLLLLEGIAGSPVKLDLSRQQHFDMNGLRIDIDTDDPEGENTLFINGGSSDIGYDTRLTVTGRFTAPGVVRADVIEFFVPPNVTASGTVEAVDTVNRQIRIAGLSIDIDNATRMLDASALAIQKFSLDDLAIGDQVTAYILQTDNQTRALFLRRDALAADNQAGDNLIRLRGFANSPAPPAFRIGSIPVATDATTIFRNSVQGSITADDFFTAMRNDSLAEAEGLWRNDRLEASMVRFLNLGNLTITSRYDGSVLAGANDFFTVWDGSLNTEEDLANGSTRVNMFISNREMILGTEWNAHDIRVFAPGRYVFDTCANNPQADNCETIEMVVGENQLGVHMLVDWGNEINIDVVNVWNRRQTFCPPAASDCALYGMSTNPIWDLAASDADNDGLGGVTLRDGNFNGQINVNFNLNF